MARVNPLVKGIRAMETRLEDYLEQDNSYKIAIRTEPDGKFVASTNVNGHVFEATHAQRNRASLQLQQAVDAAIEDGVTVHNKV